MELEHEIFHGKKEAISDVSAHHPQMLLLPTQGLIDRVNKEGFELHRKRVLSETVQVAAVACRIIQELCK